MALLSSILLFASAYLFYNRSERNDLCKAYSLLTFCLSLWCFLMFLGQFHFSTELRIFIINLTPIPSLFIPWLATYIIMNYTRPHDPVSVPEILSGFHTVAIITLSLLSLFGHVSPVYFDGDTVHFKASISYYFILGYIYLSLLSGLGVITYNLFYGNYIVRLHSIYLFSGILLACVISSVFLFFLPLLGIYLNSLATLGMLGFLWLSWIPITKYRLFNVDLVGFREDFRNPNFSSVIISINRLLLNWMDPISFKNLCDQFENQRREEIFELHAELITEAAYTEDGSTSEQAWKYSNKVTKIFLR
ncbi:hypothetical protein EHO59_07600 [Leptospira semungkisensis]|uniref:Histidine kinase N-terminal 7TM region domain-containing protein n=1 Tax=Leptospira semungkisensis TaxID=2484985 RepID=A0A4V3JCZ6_9LEPT|nr:histidine kinase N-terminal 7TM domain-containing protein [Leptospira semungkisensis]TGK07949.1 hypothetical protein EHO59_07600 [Leptospira semungkisensis]